MNLTNLLVTWGTNIKRLRNLTFSTFYVFWSKCQSFLCFFMLLLRKSTDVQLWNFKTLTQIGWVPAYHCEETVSFQPFALVDIYLDLHWSLPWVVHEALNLDVLWAIYSLEELQWLNRPSDKRERVLFFERSKTMPITDHPSHHIHNLKQSSYPNLFLSIFHQCCSKLLVLSNVEVNWAVWILEMILSFILDIDFRIFFN